MSVAAIKLLTGLKKKRYNKSCLAEVDFEQIVESMQIQHKVVLEAKKGNEIGIKMNEKVRRGYQVFKK